MLRVVGSSSTVSHSELDDIAEVWRVLGGCRKLGRYGEGWGRRYTTVEFDDVLEV